MSFWSTALDWAGKAADVYGAYSSYDQAKNAAQQQASALNNMTSAATQAAQFKPYSVTTGFGSSYFDTDKNQAGYEMNPLYQAFRDRNLSGSAGVYDQLGAFDPQQAAATFMGEQQALLQPQRMAEDIALRNQQLGRGRIGMGLSGAAAGAGMGGMVNPEQFSLQRARALADAQMASTAREQGQADIDRLIGRASGLFQTGAGIEQLGQGSLTLGADLGKAGASAGGNIAQSLLTGGQQAANANYQAALGKAAAQQALLGSFGGMFGNR